jgi:hypothetical protein
MAYVPANLTVEHCPMSASLHRTFHYTTASDADATIVGAGYFSDGVDKGMRVGDPVFVVATTGPKWKIYQVASVSGSAATVAAPTAIT